MATESERAFIQKSKNCFDKLLPAQQQVMPTADYSAKVYEASPLKDISLCWW
jgi:hypothetical protein